MTLASRSLDQQKQKYQHDKEKKVNEEKKKGLERAKIIPPLPVPGSLQTVLENLPLVYNADSKSLQQATVSAGSNDGEEKVAFKRGHHRRSSYESAEIQLTHHNRCQSSHRKIHWINNELLTTPNSFLKSGPQMSSKLRESPSSSYETNHLSRSVSFKDDNHRICGQSFDNSSLIGSVSVTVSGAMVVSTPAVATTGTPPDSAIGESLSSKRSSLDRHGELSAGIIRDCNDDSVDNEDKNSDEGIGFANEDSVIGNKPRRRNKKNGQNTLSLFSSALTKKLFTRSKNHGHQQTNPWILFRSKQWKNGCGDHAAYAISGASCSSAEDDICCSTTGLILEDRPSTLPAKSVAEQRRHEAQYLALIEAAKRQEARRVRQRQQLLEMKRKEEDETAAAAEVWCSRILPNWENMKDSKYCRGLWWRGIPSKVRGHVWSLAIGNDLNLTPELYEICVTRARQHAFTTTVTRQCGANDSSATAFINNDQRFIPSIPKVVSDVEGSIGREGTLELIHLDVSRTFPHLGFFQKGGPYEELLLDLLGAYVCYRPDIGYVQSMCFLGGMLLLQIHQPYQSFQAFANLLNRPLMLAFFGLRQPQMTIYFIAYDQYFEQELPKLHHHFDVLDIRPDMYLIEWVYTLYAKSLPFDVCCRIWDVFLRDDEQFIFNTAIGIMHLYQNELEKMNDFDTIVHFLTHLPESVNVNQLFDAIEPYMKYSLSGATSEHGNGKKRSFQQIYSDISERISQAPVMVDGGGKFGFFSFSMDTLRRNREPSFRDCKEASCKSVIKKGTDEGSYNAGEQQAAALRLNMCSMKMSKSLSEFVDDLLRDTSKSECDIYSDVLPKSRAPTAV